ncbi:helix-turn-helix domain-containing protein [Nonomuraea sp. NPDC049309]|uniref:helix-turn-helix domain-containing protein n=1 Tax=Nonomuraea sp. NPDC049309 TaxID=3364350 RepID=UPI0037160C00
MRSFQRAYGVPPHRYRNLVRLARAKEMPAAGKSVAEVAGELGFFDQSHLNRHFRQPFGMSAGAFAKAVR